MFAAIVIAAIVLIMAGIAAAFLFFRRKDFAERALELAEAGMFTDARGLVRSRLDHDPENPMLHYLMVRIYSIEGDEANELHHLLQIYRIGRSVPDLPMPVLTNRIASIYYRNERYSDSFQYYNDALKMVPENEEALARLAFLCAGQEKFEAADRYFSRLVQLKPDVFEYRLGRGICLSQLRKKDALAEFEAACQIDPDNLTANLFYGLEGFFQGAIEPAIERLLHALELAPESEVEYIIRKALTVLFFQKGDYNSALHHSEQALRIALEERWEREEYDARISTACMAIMAGDLETANENLLTLEMRNMNDPKIISLSDYRMNVEEGLIPAGEVSPSGFNFRSFLADWARSRFSTGFLYQISNLKMERKFDIDAAINQDGSPRISRQQPGVDSEELIERFNSLKGQAFETACRKIVAALGYRFVSMLPYRDSDGMDILAQSTTDKNRRAIFEIRKWKNQSISDIFLRNMQNQINEQKAQEGYVIAAARLTDGAQTALQTLNKIKVINEFDLIDLLMRVLDSE
jgi:tetratricopeptide (TPR) repeat protein